LPSACAAAAAAPRRASARFAATDVFAVLAKRRLSRISRPRCWRLRRALRSLGRGLCGLGSEEHEQLADRLDACRAKALGQLHEQRFAGFAFVAGHADLDELVGGQRSIDLLDDRLAEALCTEQDHGIEAMRAALEGLSFLRRQGDFCH
jgi:hypothetical protein